MSEGAHIAVKKSERDKLLERSFDMAAKEFPWIEELRDRSITEVEMRMVRDFLQTFMEYLLVYIVYEACVRVWRMCTCARAYVCACMCMACVDFHSICIFLLSFFIDVFGFNIVHAQQVQRSQKGLVLFPRSILCRIGAGRSKTTLSQRGVRHRRRSANTRHYYAVSMVKWQPTRHLSHKCDFFSVAAIAIILYLAIRISVSSF